MNAIFSNVQGILLFDFVYEQVLEPPNTPEAALQHKHTHETSPLEAVWLLF